MLALLRAGRKHGWDAPGAKQAAEKAKAVKKGFTVAPDEKAALALKKAQAIEKTGNPKAALTYYREVVEAHLGTLQAETAVRSIERIETRLKEADR